MMRLMSRPAATLCRFATILRTLLPHPCTIPAPDYTLAEMQHGPCQEPRVPLNQCTLTVTSSVSLTTFAIAVTGPPVWRIP